MNLENTSRGLLTEFSPQLTTWKLREKIWFGFWLIIFLLGLYALYIQITKGHIVTGMRDNVVWGLYIANFIFFIGISYAGAIISGALHLFKVEWRKPILRIAELITVISTIIGPLYILLCVGRLDRLHHLILYPRLQSPITWDVLAIGTYLIGSMIFLYLALIRDFAILARTDIQVSAWKKKLYKFFSLGFRNTPEQRKKLDVSTNILALLIIPTAIIVHSVLSWIFGMTLRPGWHSTIFGPYFVLAAIYSGTGVLIVALWAFRKIYKLEKYILEKHFIYLGYLLVALALGYGYFTFSEYLTDWYSSEKWNAELLNKLFDPKQYGWWFLFANLGGVLLPIVVIGIRYFRSINSIAVVSFILVMAMWVKRYLIVVPTLETTLLPMQDTRLEYVKYSATWVEWALTFAGIAMFFLMFKLASKFVPIIPIWETSEFIEAEKKESVHHERSSFISSRIIMKKLISLLLLIPFLGFSFQEDVLPTEMSLLYFQKGEMIELQTTLLDEDGEPVMNVEIKFTVQINEKLISLGSATTNATGVAILKKELSPLRKQGHQFLFEATFDGTDGYEAASATREIQDAILHVKAEVVDSVNTVFIQLVSWNEEGEEAGIGDTEVYFLIPRMFSLLPIGESYTDEAGEDQFEFPTDLPGGPAGELILVSKVDEHEDFGTIEARIDVTWGIPTNNAALPDRSLWSPDAPLWMLITFIILMSGVWFHYYLIIYKLYQIKKKGSVDEPIIYTE